MKILRRFMITTTLLLSLAPSLPAFQSSDWIKFAPAGGDFSVMVPGDLKQLESKPIENFTAHTYGALIDGAVYVACYGDYAPSIRLDPEKELLANRDNFLKGLDGTATSTTKIELDGRKGIAFTG